MANTQLTLTASDQISGTLDKVKGKLSSMERDATAGAARMSSSLGKLQQNWVAVTVAVTAAAFTLNKLFSMAEGAAQLEENVGRLARQTGEFNLTARQMAESVQAAVNGQLSFAESVKLSGQALAQSFSPEQIVTFAKLAEVSSDVLGGAVAANFDTLVASIATGRTTVLKQIGILIDLDEEKKKLALSTNRLAAEISAAEEKQLLLNAVMAKAPGVLQTMGDSTMSRADEMGAFKAQISDLGDMISTASLNVGQFTFGALQWIAAGMTRFASNSEAAQLATEELTGKGMRNMGFALDQNSVKIENQIVKTQRLGDGMVELFNKQQDLLKGVNVGSQAHHVAAWEIEQEKIATKALAAEVSILASAQSGLNSIAARAFDAQLAKQGSLDDKLRLLRGAVSDTTDPKELEKLLGKTGALRSEAEQRGKSTAEAEAKLLDLEKQRETVSAQSMVGSREQLDARRAQIEAVDEQVRKQKEFVNTLQATGGQATDDVDRLARDIEGKLKDAYTTTLAGAKDDFLKLSAAINDGKKPADEYATLLRDGFSTAAAEARKLRADVDAVNTALGSLGNNQLAAFALAKQTVSNNARVFNPTPSDSTPPGDFGNDGFIGPQFPGGADTGGGSTGGGFWSSDVTGGGFSDFGSSVIPAFARGGIVRRPTLALVGEAGPEAIVPLGRGGAAAGVTVHLTVNGGFSTADEIRRTVRDVLIPQLREVMR